MEKLVKKRINIAATPPLSNMELADLGDYYFVLAQHYLHDTNYRKFFDEKRAEGKKHIILDNGAGDYEQVGIGDLEHATRMLMPDEVIPIDTIGDSRATYENFKLATLWAPPGVGILACPQGASVGDYINCYSLMSAHPRTTRMAISKIAGTALFNEQKVGDDTAIEDTRPRLFTALMLLGMVVKNVHLLGMGSLKEMRRYNHWVTSADSCLPVWAAMNGQIVDNMYRRMPTPKDYFERVIGSDANGIKVYDLAKKNVYNLQHNVWNDVFEYKAPSKKEVKPAPPPPPTQLGLFW